MPESQIFRKVALDRLSSPEQIDQVLQVTTARSWVALLALFVSLAAALIWSMTSFIDTTVNAQGVISQAGGVDNVVALGTGTVTDIGVKVGDTIRAGQIVARISQPSLEQQVRQAEAELADAERAKTSVLVARTEADKGKVATMKQQITGDEQDIAHTLDQVGYAREQVPVDEQLLTKGLITKQAAIENKQKVASLESKVEQLRVQIAQVKGQQVATQDEASQLAIDYTNRTNNLSRNLELARQAFRNASEVVTPGAGRVVEVTSYRGALISAGQPMLSYEPTSGKLEAVAYVPADRAKEIQPGMKANISPSGVLREEYGYMLGRVHSIGYFPSTFEAIARVFENESLAHSMMSDGPVTEVHLDLLTSAITQSGYVWSSPKGPPTSITSGSVSTVEIVTRAQHPIELVIPYVKKQLGLK